MHWSRSVTAVDGHHLGLVDAVVAILRPRRELVATVLLRGMQRRVAGGGGLVDAGAFATEAAFGAAPLHARVVAVQTGVLRDLEVLDAARLAVPVLALRVLDARAAPRRRGAERHGQGEQSTERPS